MKFLLCLVFSILFTSNLAADEIRKTNLPQEVQSLMRDVPDDIKDLQWNRWTSENFTVLAINNAQAQFLHNNLELIKSWIYSRWGFTDIDFAVDCKLVVVDSPELFEKMFRIKNSRVEVRKTSDKIGETVIFMLVDNHPSDVIPVPLSEICFSEFANRHGVDFGWWAYRGMSLLNGSLAQIREEIIQAKPYLDQNKPMFFSESLLGTTKDKYNEMPAENKALFDKSALITCLLIRKEFGQAKFHQFLKKCAETTPELAIKEVLGFKSYEDFDATLKRYMIDITNDVQNRVTPDRYLQISAPQD